MSQQFHCQVEANGETLNVSPVGTLNVDTAPHLRAVLNKAMAEGPTTIVVDVTHLRFDDAAQLMIFASMAKRAAADFHAALHLYTADSGLAETLAGLGVNRLVPVYRQRAEAAAHRDDLGAPGAQPPRRLAPTPTAPELARQFIADACTQWRVTDPVTDRLKLIVTELVTNVVVHARTPMELTARQSPHHVHVAVHDDDPRPAQLQPPPTVHAAGGRGLLLVAASATIWGCTPTPTGKKTWATVSTRSTASAPGGSPSAVWPERPA